MSTDNLSILVGFGMGICLMGGICLPSLHTIKQERDDYLEAWAERLLEEPEIRWQDGQAIIEGPDGQTLAVVLTDEGWNAVEIGR